MITIKHRYTGAVLHSSEKATMREALEEAIAAGSDLRGSDLRGSDLSGSDLRGSDLRGSDLSGSDLRDSDLSGSDLSGSDLSGSDLRGSDLRGSDLRGSPAPVDLIAERDAARIKHPRIPVVENLDRLIAAEAPAALDMSQWHCGTKHCRAGWAVHLAGEAGYKLQARLGPFLAGRLIYLVSTGRRPDFFANDEEALADIERCAKEGAADATPNV